MSKIAHFWLLTNGERYPLSQVAPEFVILRRPAAIPSGPAILVIEIEGSQEHRSVDVLPIDKDRPLSDRVAIGRI